MPLGGLAIGLGAGLLKDEFVDKPAYKNKQYIASQTQRYSPWTGLQAQAPTPPSAVGDMLQGGISGAQMGGAVQQANANQDLANAQMTYLNGASGAGAAASPASMAPTSVGAGISSGGTPISDNLSAQMPGGLSSASPSMNPAALAALQNPYKNNPWVMQPAGGTNGL